MNGTKKRRENFRIWAAFYGAIGGSMEVEDENVSSDLCIAVVVGVGFVVVSDEALLRAAVADSSREPHDLDQVHIKTILNCMDPNVLLSASPWRVFLL